MIADAVWLASLFGCSSLSSYSVVLLLFAMCLLLSRKRRGKDLFLLQAETTNSLLQKLHSAGCAGRITPSVSSTINEGKFLTAVLSGHVEEVKRIVGEVGDEVLTVRDEHLRTPLMIACELGHIGLARFLLSKSTTLGSMEAQDDISRTVLEIAVTKCDVLMIGLLISHGANIACDCELLVSACVADHCGVVALLLERGADVNARDSELGDTPLHRAAQCGNVDTVTLLLDRGALIDSLDSMRRTPLARSIEASQLQVAKILLDRGADVEDKDSQGHGALHHACEKRDQFSIRMLLENGADVETRDTASRTLLMRASSLGRKDVAELLLNMGSDPDAVDSHGETALHAAAYHDRLDLCLLLESYGADPSRLDNEGRSALSAYGCIRSTSTEEESRAYVAQLIDARGEYLAQLERDRNWQRRAPWMMFLNGSKFQPLKARRLAIEQSARGDPAALLPPINISTPEKKKAHLVGLAFENEGVIRRIGGFL